MPKRSRHGAEVRDEVYADQHVAQSASSDGPPCPSSFENNAGIEWVIENSVLEAT